MQKKGGGGGGGVEVKPLKASSIICDRPTSKSGIMRWNRFRNFEATYLANPGS